MLALNEQTFKLVIPPIQIDFILLICYFSSELPPGIEDLPIEEQQRILAVMTAAMEDESAMSPMPSPVPQRKEIREEPKRTAAPQPIPMPIALPEP